MPWSAQAHIGLRPIGLLETSDDRRLDRWTTAARDLLAAPVALLGVLDGEREILRSLCGLGEPWTSRREIPLSESISRHAVSANAPFIVEDAGKDARFSGNGALDTLGAAACLACPLTLPDGSAFGALYVLDRQPRQWTERDKETLEALCEAVRLEVALRIEQVARKTLRSNLRNIMQHMLIHTAVLAPDGTYLWVNEAGLPTPGLGPNQLEGTRFLDAPWWLDNEETRALLADKLAAAVSGESSRFDVRINTPHGAGKLDLTLVPILDGDGATSRIVVTGIDVTERAAVEERQKLLMQEMAHRIRNLISVIMSVSSQSLASAKSLEDASSALRERLMAMARCHAALVENDWNGVRLDQLIGDELRAYEGRVAMEGPPVNIDGASAQTLSLILHELATNAAKHGALSNGEGQVRIDWRREAPDRVRLQWIESGGPPVSPPEYTGFGHDIIARIAEHEFSASPEIQFSPDGLNYAIAFPG